MYPRAEDRILKRMPCSIEIQGEYQKAIVLNLSRAGLFVQTMVAAKRGQSASIVLDSKHTGPLDLPTKVVWKRCPAARMYELGGRGVGLQISRVTLPYLDLCDELLPVVKPAPRAGRRAEKPKGQRYRVRLRLAGSARTRRFEFESRSEASAAAAALERAARAMPGQSWEVIDVSLCARANSI